MRRYMKMFGRGLKYATYLGVSTFTGCMLYLQYISSQIGRIDMNRQELVKFYIQNEKMSQQQAVNMYYWVFCDIAMMRIMTYGTYSSYCDKLNRKIVTPALKRYQDKQLFTKIQETNPKNNKFKTKSLYKEINLVRNENMKAIVDNQYILKELRKQQKLMDTRRLIGFGHGQLDKVQKVHKFVCDSGLELKEPQVLQYVAQLPMIQKKLPGDMLHKIMFI